MTTRNPNWISPEIKYKLMRKIGLTNRLSRQSASQKGWERHGKLQFNKNDSKANAKDIWAAARKLTGTMIQCSVDVEGVIAELLNDHNAAISADHSFTSPRLMLLSNLSDTVISLDFSQARISWSLKLAKSWS